MSGTPNNEGSPPSFSNSLHSHHSNGYNSISFTSTTFTDNYSRNDNENMQDDFGSIAAPPNIQISQESQMNNEMHNTGDMEISGFNLSPTASFFPSDQVYDFMETENGPLAVSQQPIADERIDSANMMSDFQIESEENDDDFFLTQQEIEPNPQPSPSKLQNQNSRSPPSYLNFMDAEPISQDLQPSPPLLSASSSATPLKSSSRKIFSSLEYQPRIYEDRTIKNLISESSESLKDVDILEPNQLNMNYFRKTGFRNVVLVNSINKMTDFNCPEITRDNLIITLTGLDLKAYNIETRKYESFNQNQWLEIYNHASVTHRTIQSQPYRFISTDISNTILNSFHLPKIIHDLDFKSLVPKYKDIRSGLYLLMAVSGFYLDFHIEQSGTAVWYYCCDGDLYFYLICPNEENLELFKEWYESNSIDSNILYADMQDNDGNQLKEKLITITLKVGDFMIIPSGWIYSFYCSSNAILFSGNFLHGFDLLVELYIRDLEETLKYPDNILYENFQEELWHGCQKYLGLLRLMSFNGNNNNNNNNNSMISSYELNGLPSLICSLSNWFQCLSDECDNDAYDNSIREAANNASIATHCNGPLDMLSELITRLRKEQWKERKNTIPKISYSVESETTMQQVLGDNNSDDDNNDNDNKYNSENNSSENESESDNNSNIYNNNNMMMMHSIGKVPPPSYGLIGSGKYIPINNNNSYSDDDDDNDSDDNNNSDDFNYNNNNYNNYTNTNTNNIISSIPPLPSTYFVDCICGLRGMNLKDNLPLVQCCICQVYFHKDHVLQSNYNTNNYYCHKCKEKQLSPQPPDLPPKPPALPPKPIIINISNNPTNKINNNNNNNNKTKKVVKINENNVNDNILPSKKRRRRSFQKDYEIDDDYVEKEEEYIYNEDGEDDGDGDYGSGDYNDDNEMIKKKKNTKKRKRTNYYVNQINSDRKAQHLLMLQQQQQNGVVPVVQPPPKKKEKTKKESSFKNIMKNLKRKRD